jgi:rhodanese-related sulfurtransferase
MCARAESVMRTIFRQALALALLASLPAAGAAFFNPNRPAWQSDEVTPALAQAWGEKVLWLDARAQADFDTAHIPGALPLNEDAWNALLPDVLAAWDPEKTVVVYCSSLSCHTSREVALRLRSEVGLPAVFVLEGGWESWKKAHP